ncbi:hypothetical protein AJ80_06499 [Polytolypa hystricis UAMH7299]|uniref:DUF7732 domain-containing protein n=1 Tax=Polytolypa hystricis (strain UAMH7299) TaxID=1447883 RepID=A0A2B7XVN3_POLH7|nr:hypothetical protein AJ80_06499 [Polytolypa hystricis UAMH7299]
MKLHQWLLSVSIVSNALATVVVKSPATRANPTEPLSLERRDHSELAKRKKGGGGGDSYGDAGDSSGDDGGSSDGGGGSPAPCTPTPYVVRQGAMNEFGYGYYYFSGPGKMDSLDGGYTRNGSGSPPTWQNTNGTWVFYQWHWNVEFDHEHSFYFPGGAVPFLAGEASPRGIKPELTEFDYKHPEDDIYNFGYGAFDEFESTWECLMPEESYAYKYPVQWDYLETIRPSRESSEDFNQTTPVDVICCCDKGRLCGCDYNGDSKFLQKLGSMHITRPIYSDSVIKNTTRICYFPIKGQPTLLINGTLTNGSTKGNDSIPEPPLQTKMSVCPSLGISLLQNGQVLGWAYLGTAMSLGLAWLMASEM